MKKESKSCISTIISCIILIDCDNLLHALMLLLRYVEGVVEFNFD